VFSRSLAIEHLQNLTAGESNKSIVLFQYISHLHDCERRVAALLAQTLQYRRRLSPAVRDRNAHHRPLNSRPTTAGLIDALITELAEYEDVYIVIDALDAARDQVRAQFVKSLCSICNKRPGVRLLFASHDKQILGRDVTDVQYYEVVAKLSDLESFIQTQMKDKGAISNVTEDDPKLIEEITRILINRAHGLFLLAYQHLDASASHVTDTRLESSLLPFGGLQTTNLVLSSPPSHCSRLHLLTSNTIPSRLPTALRSQHLRYE